MSERVADQTLTEVQDGTVGGFLECLGTVSDKDPSLGNGITTTTTTTRPTTATGSGQTEPASVVDMDGDRRNRTLDEWTANWEIGKIGFHNDSCHPKFVQYIDNLVNGRKELKFFFPLCGKTLDMKWMYDEGHTVIGVEVSPKAIEEFFLENDITYIAENVPTMDGAVYKSEDNRIRIYCGDFFKFSPSIEKDMTAIFDRGSLVAINKADRGRYVDLLLSLMATDVRYMLNSYNYDPSKYSGPPHHISIDELNELFSSRCTMDLLDLEDVIKDKRSTFGLDQLEERVHMLTLKQ